MFFKYYEPSWVWFRLKYIQERVIIALTLLNQKEHFLYYLVPLLEEVKKEIEGKEDENEKE